MQVGQEMQARQEQTSAPLSKAGRVERATHEDA
jgi:hypothetical protein